MSDLESYLASDGAAEDAAAAIAWPAPHPSEYRAWWRIETDGAWTRVHVGMLALCVEATAYFRPEGDRYIVSDLGEGVRALRLRTGDIWSAVLDCGPRVSDTDGVLYAVGEEGWMWRVAAADLPSAICRVLLASHRVSHMEATSSPPASPVTGGES